jgi:hypothetical protein
MFELNFPYHIVKWIGLVLFQAAMENNPFIRRAEATYTFSCWLTRDHSTIRGDL